MISLTVFKVTVPESTFGPSLILSFSLQKGAPSERGGMAHWDSESLYRNFVVTVKPYLWCVSDN